MLKEGQKRNEKGHIDTEDIPWVEQLQDGKPIVTSDIDKLAFIKTEMLVEAGAEDDTGHRGYKFEYYEEGGHGLYSLTVTDIKTDKTVYSMNDFDEINDMVESGYLDMSDPEAFIDYLIDDVKAIPEEAKEKSIDTVVSDIRKQLSDLKRENPNKYKALEESWKSIPHEGDEVFSGSEFDKWLDETADEDDLRKLDKTLLDIVVPNSGDKFEETVQKGTPATQKGKRGGEWYIDTKGKRRYVKKSNLKVVSADDMSFNADAPIGSRFGFGSEPEMVKHPNFDWGYEIDKSKIEPDARAGEGKETALHGFDYTHFDTPENFKKILGKNGISETPEEYTYSYNKTQVPCKMFVWKGDGIELVTGHDPIAGDHSIGYAGDIGIRGDAEKVAKLVTDIKENADIKGLTNPIGEPDGESVGELGFLGFPDQIDTKEYTINKVNSSNVDANTEKLRELGRQAYVATRDKNKELGDSIAEKIRTIQDGLSSAEKVFVAQTILEGHDEAEKGSVAEPVAETQLDKGKRSKKFDLGFGHLGNGLAVWNRAKEVNGDYESVAHIDSDRKITWRIKDVPEEVKAEVERVANGPNMGVSTSQPEQKVFKEDVVQQTEPAWQKGRKYKGQEAYYIIDPKSGRRVYKKRAIIELLKIAQKLEADGLKVEAAELDKIVGSMEVEAEIDFNNISRQDREDILFSKMADTLREQNGTDIQEILTTDEERSAEDTGNAEEVRKVITALSHNGDVSTYVERLINGENVRSVLADFAVNTADEKKVLASLRSEAVEDGFTFNSNAPDGERFGVDFDISSIIQKAKELGKKSFDDGKTGIPARSVELNDLLFKSDKKLTTEQLSQVMDAYIKSWTTANLSAPVPGWTDEENAKLLERNGKKPSTEMQKSDEERARELGSAFSKAQDSKHSNPDGMADISIEWHKMMEGKTEEEKKKLSDAFVEGGKEMTRSNVNKGTVNQNDFNASKELKGLSQFIGNNEMMAIKDGLKGEEKSYFADKIKEMSERIKTMPKTYEQDGKGDNAIAYLHYFKGGADFYITEKDMETEQLQAFGLAKLSGNEPELGYISIQELLDNDMELDLHFTPKTIGEIKNVSEPTYQKGRKYKGQEAEYYIDPKTQKRVYKGHKNG